MYVKERVYDNKKGPFLRTQFSDLPRPSPFLFFSTDHSLSTSSCLFSFSSVIFLLILRRQIYITDIHTQKQYARVVLSLYITTLSVLTTLFCFLEDVLLLFYVQTSLFGSSLYLLYNQSNTIVDLLYCIHTCFLLSPFIIHITFPCYHIIISSSH